nr:uncharacterized protein LOC131788170 [Pocillopora verrucosa]
MTSKETFNVLWLRVDNLETITVTFVNLGIACAPIIFFGYSLVIWSIWKDPLKKLRRSPSGLIVLSMATADFLIGSVLLPTAVTWGWSMFHFKIPRIPYLAVSAVFVYVSVGHIFLLTLDRFFAIVSPLQYRAVVTPKGISVAIVSCWIYFFIFEITFGLLQHRYFIIMETAYNIQIISILLGISVMSAVMKKPKKCRKGIFKSRMKGIDGGYKLRELLFGRGGSADVIVSVTAVEFSLMHANSGVNPFIYAWRFPKYRETFMHLLKRRNNRSGQFIEHQFYDTRL